MVFMNKEVCCPKCSELIVKSMGNEIKVRAKVTIFRDNECFAVCKGCNGEVKLPIALDHESLEKSFTPQKNPYLYLNKGYFDKKT